MTIRNISDDVAVAHIFKEDIPGCCMIGCRKYILDRVEIDFQVFFKRENQEDTL